MNPETGRALRQADAEFSRSFEAKDLERMTAFFVEDAVMLAVSNPVITGKPAIRALLSQAFSLPGFSTRLKLTGMAVSDNGDLGYTLGTYQSSMAGPEGEPRSHEGKYVAVWRKQAEGVWKVVVHSSSPN
ncbi:MAG: SgcJ/EcaC family oxidoreductase [Candidatus Acidiferrales bacterium]